MAFSEKLNFTAEADTDVNHLQEEQFSSTVCDLSSQDDSVQPFPEQVVLNSFVEKYFRLLETGWLNWEFF